MKKIWKNGWGPQWLRWVLFSLGAVGIGVGTVLAVQWIVCGSWAQATAWVARYPAQFALTATLYGMVAYAVAALCNSLAASAGLVGLLGIVLATVDFFKTAINGTPLTFADLKLASQLGDVAGVAGELVLPEQVVAALWLLVLVTAVLVLVFPLTRLAGRWRFLSGSIAMVLALHLFSVTGARDAAALFAVPVDARADISTTHATFGLSLSLWRDCFFQDVPAPAGYSQATMEAHLARMDELLSDYDQQVEEPPNVLLILSESFFDVNRLPGLTYDRDPLENFHALAKEGVSGEFFTHYLGYGTGYIEMSLLQGINGLDFGAGVNLCFLDEDAYTRLPSLLTPFKERGYRAEMLHSFDNSLYNRTVTYPLLGFDRLLFSDGVQALDMDWVGSKYGGYYLKDSYLFSGLLNQLEESNQAGQKAFLFGISMENHQPFDVEKFGGESQIELTTDALNPADQEIAKVMLEGITRADQALGKLAEQLRDVPEPTVVVFFGDHRPNLFLSDGETIYTELGLCPENDTLSWTPEEVGEIYSTDYLIWANDAALLEQQAGRVEPSSVSALGPKLLEVTGVGYPRYWALLDKLAEYSLTDTELYFTDGQGTAYETAAAADLSPEAQELMALKKAVTYDAYYGKQYITSRMKEPVGS